MQCKKKKFKLILISIYYCFGKICSVVHAIGRQPQSKFSMILHCCVCVQKLISCLVKKNCFLFPFRVKFFLFYVNLLQS